MGHARNYVPTDVLARYFRMRGFAVLHPMGWDAFGLPAENEALQRGRHPRVTTGEYAQTYRRQLQLLGCSYDWTRELATSDPDFYRGTQWGFLLLYRRGLVYRASGRQWWCPKCRTILANEQVVRGRCWRHPDTPVERRTLDQWYVRSTAYADRLIADLDQVDWPEQITAMQRNWIGRSEGMDLRFQIDGRSPLRVHEIIVFTTRPETVMDATFIALAPEHPLAATIAASEYAHDVQAYVSDALRRPEVDRLASAAAPSGLFTGAWVVHPLTGARLPVFIADYVVGHYGTGAIMGVPAWDDRDAQFARHTGLAASPPSTDGRVADDAVRAMQSAGRAAPAVRYKMRDWLISRQRYWGAPIPLVHCPRCGVMPVPEDQLPVLLPDVAQYEPSGTGRSPLAAMEQFVRTRCPQCGGPAERETDTLDGFADSNWYFLRFPDPRFGPERTEGERTRTVPPQTPPSAGTPWSPDAVRYWLPVDYYVGGAEHAVMHLLYARFFTKVLYDAGLIPFVEPFLRLRNQGSMLSPRDGSRMSKSRGNVVVPDDVADAYGADALRVGVMFLGPFEQDVTWDPAVMQGASRFIRRLHRVVHDHVSARRRTGETRSGGPDPEDAAAGDAGQITARVDEIVKAVAASIEQFRFNVLIAQLMTFLRDLERWGQRRRGSALWDTVLRTTIRMLAPVTPFLAEEAWAMLGELGSVHQAAWPAPAATEETASGGLITVVVQVDGRRRDRLRVRRGASPADLVELSKRTARVQAALRARRVDDVIVVPDRIVNFVTSAGAAPPEGDIETG